MIINYIYHTGKRLWKQLTLLFTLIKVRGILQLKENVYGLHTKRRKSKIKDVISG